jgi:predicted lipid-binding transport protein (Tim44 family)
MSDGFAYIDILFFAMAAAFVALRLRSVLGRRTGNERQRGAPVPPSAPSPTANQPAGDNVVPMPDRAAADMAVPPAVPTADAVVGQDGDASLKEGITAIRLADPNFDLDMFLAGARAAFTMVVEAFAQGDKNVLKPLLAPTVYQSFAQAIDGRAAAGQVMHTELVSVRNAELAGAELRDSIARVTVRFRSEQINCIKNGDGLVLEGDPAAVEQVVDLWTFERDVRSADPNWALAETRSPA